MKFKSAEIGNFKRFTELAVKDIPKTAKLIMLAGPNGCGKSSFLDALHYWYRRKNPKHLAFYENDQYYKKDKSKELFMNIFSHDDGYNNETSELRVYVRSSYRNDPGFSIDPDQWRQNLRDEKRIYRMIDNDEAIGKNFQILVEMIFNNMFDPCNKTKTLDDFCSQEYGELRKQFEYIFNEIQFRDFKNPLSEGRLRFTKNESSLQDDLEGISFMNLSSGEKAAFDLILDLFVAVRRYQKPEHVLFCIDEPEIHLNGALHSKLLKVLYGLTEQYDNFQLVLATHSIGMMREARDIAVREPGKVAFLDFNKDLRGHDLNFDISQTITPRIPDRPFWENILSVALADLASLIAPSRVIICEGRPPTSSPGESHSFDAQCYERIFSGEFPDVKFLSAGGSNEVLQTKSGLANMLNWVIGGLEVIQLIDRDDRADDTIKELKNQGIRVLSRRHLESYLFDNEVLKKLKEYSTLDDKEYDAEFETFLQEKNSIVLGSVRRGNPYDDLKKPSGDIHKSAKKILKLKRQCGNNVNEFQRVILAPLIRPGMTVYETLKEDIFGK